MVRDPVSGQRFNSRTAQLGHSANYKDGIQIVCLKEFNFIKQSGYSDWLGVDFFLLRRASTYAEEPK